MTVGFSSMLSKILAYLTSTGSLLIGIGAQFVGFIVLARYLGAEQFGHLMVITAATAVALSVCGLGTDEVMVRRCAREPHLYPTLLGHGLILVGISGVFLSAAVILILHFFVQILSNPLQNILVLSIFAVSNIVLARLVTLAEFIFIGLRRLMNANLVVSSFASARALTALIACLVFNVDRLESWAYWHGAIHVGGAFACWIALKQFGAPQWRVLKDEIWRGIHSCTMQLINNLRQNIDRLVLSTIVSPTIVGAYSVASSMVQYSSVTLLSFSRLYYPMFSIAGQKGISATYKLAVGNFLVIVGLGVMNSIGLLVISPFLPRLFGQEFTISSHYLTILCWLPILVGVQNIAYDALGAADKHGIRARFYNATAIIGVGLIALLSYLFGVNGAFVGLYLSLVVICIAMWIILRVLAQSERSPT